MKYMLLVYSPEKSWTKEEWLQCVAESSGICEVLTQKGQLKDASPLHPVSTATTVRVREGKPLITKGPFAETTEQLGGYYLIDVPDLDEAIRLAAQLPPASKGTIEIRPLFELDGLPEEQLAPTPNAEPNGLIKFMFLCYDDEDGWRQLGEKALRDAMMDAVAITHELASDGKYLSASPLHPVATATSVQVRAGRRLVVDGPFAETREVLGGYYLILAENQGQAIDIAARHPGAALGAVEVRQVYARP